MTAAETVDRYVAFFEGMTQARLGELAALCREDVHFKDPFNDGRGVDFMRKIFVAMYADVRTPRFEVLGRALSEDQSTCFLRWRFTGETKSGSLAIDGVSEVRFDPDGRVSAHYDYWDAAGHIYERLPLLGPLLRHLRKRIAA